MSNKKQSSVEWLISQLDKYYVLSYNELKNNEAVQQAKAMHKEEIIKFAEDWGKSNLDCKEDLYTETFNSDEA